MVCFKEVWSHVASRAAGFGPAPAQGTDKGSLQLIEWRRHGAGPRGTAEQASLGL